MLEPGSCARPSEESVDKNYRATNLAAYTAVSIEGLAGFMSKDPDLWVFQNFNRLNLTNIIYLQQRLVDLERQLDEIVHQPVTEFDKPKYEELMGRLETLLSKYGRFLYQESEAQCLTSSRECVGRASKTSIFAIARERTNYLLGPLLCECPLLLGLQTCTRSAGSSNRLCVNRCRRKRLDPQTRGRRQVFQERINNSKGIQYRKLTSFRLLGPHWCHLLKQHKTKLGGSASFPSVLVVSDPNVRRIERTVINLGFCLLLLCPILALTYLENKALKVGIVLLFVLIISTLTIDLGKSTNATCVALVAG